jgi:sec-independent protein translocase protein TatB
MFDVSLTELMVIAVVALIVIGPERLPKVARTVGHLLGRLQRYVTNVKADINREMQLEELKKLQQQVTEQVRTTEAAINQDMKSLETSLNQSIAPLDKTAGTTTGTTTPENTANVSTAAAPALPWDQFRPPSDPVAVSAADSTAVATASAVLPAPTLVADAAQQSTPVAPVATPGLAGAEKASA